MRSLSRVYSILTTLVGINPWIRAVFGQNVTVDDADPNMIYAGSWEAGNDCSGCWAKPPDHSQIYDATWHDTTAHPGDEPKYFQYQFTGTDLYIYSIQVDTVPVVDVTYGPVSKVDLTITIDGQNQNYVHSIINVGTYEYQIPVFVVHDLPNTAHNMKVTLNPYSMFLFDYLVYTASEGTSLSTASSSPDTSISTTSSSTTSSSGTSSSGTSSSGISSFHSSSSYISSSDILPSTTSSSTSTVNPLITSVGIHNNPTEKSASLSSGAIAGIAIGVAVIIGIIAAIIGFRYGQRRRRWRQMSSDDALMETVIPLSLNENPPFYIPPSSASISPSPLSSRSYTKTGSQVHHIVPSSPLGAVSASLPPYSERGIV